MPWWRKLALIAGKYAVFYNPHYDIHMDLAQTLILNILPLYALIALGYIAGKYLDVHLHSMATIAIYIIAPVVNFGAVARLDLNPAYIILPPVIACTGFAIAALSYRLAGLVFDDNRKNLIAMATSTGNTGYFGIPIVLALLGPKVLGVYLLMSFSVVISEMAGFYLGARGVHTIRDSLKKLFSLPALYGIAAGLIWNLACLPLPVLFITWWDRFTGALIIIGMMLIGVALSKIDKLRINAKFLAFLFSAKFLLWPVCTYGFAMLDKNIFHLFDDNIYTMLLVLGTVPLAANTVAYAAQFNIRPGEAAMAVLSSTLFALIYIPLVFWMLGITV
jgi:predicted permease